MSLKGEDFFKDKINSEEEVEVELGSSDDLIPGELVYDDGADDAGSLFDFDDDL